MLRSNVALNMGVIICKHCSTEVATLSTNKVVTYYGVCDRPECRDRHRNPDAVTVVSGSYVNPYGRDGKAW